MSIDLFGYIFPHSEYELQTAMSKASILKNIESETKFSIYEDGSLWGHVNGGGFKVWLRSRSKGGFKVISSGSIEETEKGSLVKIKTSYHSSDVLAIGVILGLLTLFVVCEFASLLLGNIILGLFEITSCSAIFFLIVFLLKKIFKKQEAKMKKILQDIIVL